MKVKHLLFLITAISFLSANLSGQTIGKLFTKGEANILFGPVLESKTITCSEVSSVIGQTNQFVMFLIKNGEIAIKGDGGQVIYNGGISIDPGDVFNKYSKTIVANLLSLSNSGFITVEKRATVISITTDMTTLEEGLPCPPECY